MIVDSVSATTRINRMVAVTAAAAASSSMIPSQGASHSPPKIIGGCTTRTTPAKLMTTPRTCILVMSSPRRKYAETQITASQQKSGPRQRAASFFHHMGCMHVLVKAGKATEGARGRPAAVPGAARMERSIGLSRAGWTMKIVWQSVRGTSLCPENKNTIVAQPVIPRRISHGRLFESFQGFVIPLMRICRKCRNHHVMSLCIQASFAYPQHQHASECRINHHTSSLRLLTSTRVDGSAMHERSIANTNGDVRGRLLTNIGSIECRNAAMKEQKRPLLHTRSLKT